MVFQKPKKTAAQPTGTAPKTPATTPATTTSSAPSPTIKFSPPQPKAGLSLPGLTPKPQAQPDMSNPIVQAVYAYSQLSPEEKALQAKINALTSGTTIPAVDKDVAGLLNGTPYLNKFLNKKLGTANIANILSGTTRNLAKLPSGKPNALQNYTRDVIQTPAELQALSSFLKSTKDKGQTKELLQNFAKFGNKDLYTVLGEKVIDPAARAKLLKNLPSPIAQDKLTQLAFLESLASETVYSGETGQSLNSSGKVDDKKGGVPTELLKTFGYTAGDNIAGGWGFDMRVFTPKDKTQPIIIAMRGTEGVAADVKKNKPGTIDTAMADFALKEPGINQFEPNLALIKPIVDQAIKNGQKIIWTGHSLGGALAQEGAATFPQATAGVTTFQGANIPQAYVDKFNAYSNANPKNKIDVTHIRVDGDTVPTSGTAALPGSIHYLDYISKPSGKPGDMTISPVSDLVPGIANPFLRESAGAAAAKLPMLSTQTASTGHVIPSANMFLRQEYADSTNPKTQALLKYGPKDPTTLGGKVQSAVVYGGQYTTKKDPRLNMEAQRADVMPKMQDLGQTGQAAFGASASFSNAQEYLVNAAKGFNTFEEFQKYATGLASAKSLPMTPTTLALAKQLNLSRSPHTSAKVAANDLFGLNLFGTIKTGATLGTTAGKIVYNAGKVADKPAEGTAAAAALGAASLVNGASIATAGLAAGTYLSALNSYPETPPLDAYKTGPNGSYEVPMDKDARTLLLDRQYLRNLWNNQKSGEIKR